MASICLNIDDKSDLTLDIERALIDIAGAFASFNTNLQLPA